MKITWPSRLELYIETHDDVVDETDHYFAIVRHGTEAMKGLDVYKAIVSSRDWWGSSVSGAMFTTFDEAKEEAIRLMNREEEVFLQEKNEMKQFIIGNKD